MAEAHYDDPHQYTQSDLSQMHGMVVIEFGEPWCGHCKDARPKIEQALESFRSKHNRPVRHITFLDKAGDRLGRHYQVKLWPTLVFLYDGREVHRIVRPIKAEAIEQDLEKFWHQVASAL